MDRNLEFNREEAFRTFLAAEARLMVHQSTSRSPIFMIQELFARKDLSVNYNTENNGSTFTCTVSVDNPAYEPFTTTVTMYSENLATKEAARVFMNRMIGEEILTLKENTLRDNPIDDLQEFCQHNACSTPRYAFKEKFNNGRLQFICTCEVEPLMNIGTEGSKKFAKRRAAEEMLDSLQIKYLKKCE